jgi:uncharacterized heparinase superfamily protein
LSKQIPEQILSDGCHFERSPMYHVSMLSDVLDMIEALQGAEREIPGSLSSAAEDMVSFLAHVLHPDGEIPFLNDSTSSFTLRTQEVLARGRAMFPGSRAAADETSEINPERHSGLLMHNSGDLFVVFDAGNVGPDYQPGHAHCDTLSYEVSWKGKRVITDTGVFHYRESAERTYSRSTAAHNTVRLDNAEQSEVWKSFRVGRRAHIKAARRFHVSDVGVFQAVHDGWERFEEPVTHERALVVASSRWICVVDWLHGQGTHQYESFLHFHPDFAVTLQDTRASAALKEFSVMVFCPENEAVQLRTTEYYPAFGVKQQRKTLVLSSDVALPYMTAYTLSFDGTRPEIHLDSLTGKVHFSDAYMDEFELHSLS